MSALLVPAEVEAQIRALAGDEDAAIVWARVLKYGLAAAHKHAFDRELVENDAAIQRGTFMSEEESIARVDSSGRAVDMPWCKLVVAPRVQEQIEEYARAWDANRNPTATSFAEALIDAYAKIKNAPKLGFQYDCGEFELEVWETSLVSGHLLYFTLVSESLSKPIRCVMGVKAT